MSSVRIIQPQGLEHLVQCPVCLETVKDPAVLQCQHTFCEGCLRETYDKMKNQSIWIAPNQIFLTQSVNCPTCNAEYGVSSPSGFYRRDEKMAKLLQTILMWKQERKGTQIPERTTEKTQTPTPSKRWLTGEFFGVILGANLGYSLGLTLHHFPIGLSPVTPTAMAAVCAIIGGLLFRDVDTGQQRYSNESGLKTVYCLVAILAIGRFEFNVLTNALLAVYCGILGIFVSMEQHPHLRSIKCVFAAVAGAAGPSKFLLGSNQVIYSGNFYLQLYSMVTTLSILMFEKKPRPRRIFFAILIVQLHNLVSFNFKTSFELNGVYHGIWVSILVVFTLYVNNIPSSWHLHPLTGGMFGSIRFFTCEKRLCWFPVFKSIIFGALSSLAITNNLSGQGERPNRPQFLPSVILNVFLGSINTGILIAPAFYEDHGKFMQFLTIFIITTIVTGILLTPLSPTEQVWVNHIGWNIAMLAVVHFLFFGELPGWISHKYSRK